MTNFNLKSIRTLSFVALSVAAAISFSVPASAMPKGMSGMLGSVMENESVKGMMGDMAESDLGKSVQQQMQGRKGKRGGQGGGLGGLGSMLGGGQGGMGLDQLQGLGGSLGLD